MDAAELRGIVERMDSGESMSSREQRAVLAHLLSLTPPTPEDVERDALAVLEEFGAEPHGGKWCAPDSGCPCVKLARLRDAAARVPRLEAQQRRDEEAILQYQRDTERLAKEVDASRQLVFRAESERDAAQAMVRERDVLLAGAREVEATVYGQRMVARDDAHTRAEMAAKLAQMANPTPAPSGLRAAVRRVLDAWAMTAPAPMLRELSEALRAEATPTPAGLLEVVATVLAAYPDMPYLPREQAALFEQLGAAYDAAKGGDGCIRWGRAWKALTKKYRGAENYYRDMRRGLQRHFDEHKAKAAKWDAAVERANDATMLVIAAGPHSNLIDCAHWVVTGENLHMDTPPSGPGGGEPACPCTGGYACQPGCGGCEVTGAKPEPTVTHARLAAVMEALEDEADVEPLALVRAKAHADPSAKWRCRMCRAPEGECPNCEPVEPDDVVRKRAELDGAREVLRRVAGGEVLEEDRSLRHLHAIQRKAKQWDAARERFTRQMHEVTMASPSPARSAIAKALWYVMDGQDHGPFDDDLPPSGPGGCEPRKCASTLTDCQGTSTRACGRCDSCCGHARGVCAEPNPPASSESSTPAHHGGVARERRPTPTPDVPPLAPVPGFAMPPQAVQVAIQQQAQPKPAVPKFEEGLRQPSTVEANLKTGSNSTPDVVWEGDGVRVLADGAFLTQFAGLGCAERATNVLARALAEAKRELSGSVRAEALAAVRTTAAEDMRERAAMALLDRRDKMTGRAMGAGRRRGLEEGVAIIRALPLK